MLLSLSRSAWLLPPNTPNLDENDVVTFFMISCTSDSNLSAVKMKVSHEDGVNTKVVE